LAWLSTGMVRAACAKMLKASVEGSRPYAWSGIKPVGGDEAGSTPTHA
jgi:hypothetical protein